MPAITIYELDTKSMRLGSDGSNFSCPHCKHMLAVLRELHDNDKEAVSFALERDLDKYLNEWLEYYLEVDQNDDL